MDPEYLGDAVYVQEDSQDPHGIVLTTGHHEIEKASQIIWLDNYVIAQLQSWLARREAAKNAPKRSS